MTRKSHDAQTVRTNDDIHRRRDTEEEDAEEEEEEEEEEEIVEEMESGAFSAATTAAAAATASNTRDVSVSHDVTVGMDTETEAVDVDVAALVKELFSSPLMGDDVALLLPQVIHSHLQTALHQSSSPFLSSLCPDDPATADRPLLGPVTNYLSIFATMLEPMDQDHNDGAPKLMSTSTSTSSSTSTVIPADGLRARVLRAVAATLTLCFAPVTRNGSLTRLPALFAQEAMLLARTRSSGTLNSASTTASTSMTSAALFTSLAVSCLAESHSKSPSSLSSASVSFPSADPSTAVVSFISLHPNRDGFAATLLSRDLLTAVTTLVLALLDALPMTLYSPSLSSSSPSLLSQPLLYSLHPLGPLAASSVCARHWESLVAMVLGCYPHTRANAALVPSRTWLRLLGLPVLSCAYQASTASATGDVDRDKHSSASDMEDGNKHPGLAMQSILQQAVSNALEQLFKADVQYFSTFPSTSNALSPQPPSQQASERPLYERLCSWAGTRALLTSGAALALPLPVQRELLRTLDTCLREGYATSSPLLCAASQSAFAATAAKATLRRVGMWSQRTVETTLKEVMIVIGTMIDRVAAVAADKMADGTPRPGTVALDSIRTLLRTAASAPAVPQLVVEGADYEAENHEVTTIVNPFGAFPIFPSHSSFPSGCDAVDESLAVDWTDVPFAGVSIEDYGCDGVSSVSRDEAYQDIAVPPIGDAPTSFGPKAISVQRPEFPSMALRMAMSSLNGSCCCGRRDINRVSFSSSVSMSVSALQSILATAAATAAATDMISDDGISCVPECLAAHALLQWVESSTGEQQDTREGGDLDDARACFALICFAQCLARVQELHTLTDFWAGNVLALASIKNPLLLSAAVVITNTDTTSFIARIAVGSDVASIGVGAPDSDGGDGDQLHASLSRMYASAFSSLVLVLTNAQTSSLALAPIIVAIRRATSIAPSATTACSQPRSTDNISEVSGVGLSGPLHQLTTVLALWSSGDNPDVDFDPLGRVHVLSNVLAVVAHVDRGSLLCDVRGRLVAFLHAFPRACAHVLLRLLAPGSSGHVSAAAIQNIANRLQVPVVAFVRLAQVLSSSDAELLALDIAPSGPSSPVMQTLARLGDLFVDAGSNPLRPLRDLISHSKRTSLDGFGLADGQQRRTSSSLQSTSQDNAVVVVLPHLIDDVCSACELALQVLQRLADPVRIRGQMLPSSLDAVYGHGEVKRDGEDDEGDAPIHVQLRRSLLRVRSALYRLVIALRLPLRSSLMLRSSSSSLSSVSTSSSVSGSRLKIGAVSTQPAVPLGESLLAVDCGAGTSVGSSTGGPNEALSYATSALPCCMRNAWPFDECGASQADADSSFISSSSSVDHSGVRLAWHRLKPVLEMLAESIAAVTSTGDDIISLLEAMFPRKDGSRGGGDVGEDGKKEEEDDPVDDAIRTWSGNNDIGNNSMTSHHCNVLSHIGILGNILGQHDGRV